MTNQTLEHRNAALAEWGALRRNWGWLLALGIAWIILGSLAIIVPFAATLALELVLGAIFAVGGVAQIVQAFRCRGWRGFALHLLGGLLALVAGGLLLFFPLQGVLTLTLFLGAFFLIDGGVKIASALRHRPFANWGWLLFSGILGVAVGMLIWLGWPSSAIWALGLLAGIELIFSGWSMVMLALSARGS